MGSNIKGDSLDWKIRNNRRAKKQNQLSLHWSRQEKNEGVSQKWVSTLAASAKVVFSSVGNSTNVTSVVTSHDWAAKFDPAKGWLHIHRLQRVGVIWVNSSQVPSPLSRGRIRPCCWTNIGHCDELGPVLRPYVDMHSLFLCWTHVQRKLVV